MKKLLIILTLFFLGNSFVFCQNVISSAPTGAVMRGKLVGFVDGSPPDVLPYTEVIGDGYVFALSSESKRVLSYTRTARGTLSTGGGDWELYGLPMEGKIILVGFAANLKRMCVIKEVILNGNKYNNIGELQAHMSIPKSAPSSSIGTILQTLQIIGWIIKINETGNYYKEIDDLTSELMNYINQPIDQLPGQSSSIVGKYVVIASFGNNQWIDMQQFYSVNTNAKIYWIFNGRGGISIQNSSGIVSKPLHDFDKSETYEVQTDGVIVVYWNNNPKIKLKKDF